MSDRNTRERQRYMEGWQKDKPSQVFSCAKPKTLLFRQDDIDRGVLLTLEPGDSVRTKGLDRETRCIPLVFAVTPTSTLFRHALNLSQPVDTF